MRVQFIFDILRECKHMLSRFMVFELYEASAFVSTSFLLVIGFEIIGFAKDSVLDWTKLLHEVFELFFSRVPTNVAHKQCHCFLFLLLFFFLLLFLLLLLLQLSFNFLLLLLQFLFFLQFEFLFFFLFDCFWLHYILPSLFGVLQYVCDPGFVSVFGH